MEIYQLRTFHSVARRSSFSRAAEELAITQPAVSRQVEALERSLGVLLFSRRGRQVTLTEAGHRLLEYAGRILTLADRAAQAIEELKTLQAGRISIAASTTPGNYLLPAVVAGFRRRHPGVELTMEVCPSERVERAVLDGRVDLGVLAGPVRSPTLFVEPYLDDELVLIVPPGHPLAAAAGTDPAEIGRLLAAQRFIVRETGSATRRGMEEHLASLSVPLGDAVELGNTEAIKRAVAAGMGVSIVPRCAAANELALGTLAEAPHPSLRVRRTLNFISSKGLHPSPVSLAFRAFARKAASFGGDEDRKEASP